MQYTWNTQKDAVLAAPDSHHILLENDEVRVVEVIVPPLQKEPLHEHQWPSVMIVQESTRLKYYNNLESFEIKESKNKQKIEWMPPEKLHAVENLDSKKTYRAIRIELKN